MKGIAYKKGTQTIRQRMIDAGYTVYPNGSINEYQYQKFLLGGVSSQKDKTWKRLNKVGEKTKGYHTCCGSKRSYRHLVNCKMIKDWQSDDYSDLKDI